MMSLWDALRMNMMISYQELVRTFPSCSCVKPRDSLSLAILFILDLLVIDRPDLNTHRVSLSTRYVFEQ
ncbi:hypothetical protein DN464_25005 [Enterobacter cloacae]|nr:hypothetical protein DN464_25005 [Enterobacter cloacae]